MKVIGNIFKTVIILSIAFVLAFATLEYVNAPTQSTIEGVRISKDHGVELYGSTYKDMSNTLTYEVLNQASMKVDTLLSTVDQALN